MHPDSSDPATLQAVLRYVIPQHAARANRPDCPPSPRAYSAQLVRSAADALIAGRPDDLLPLMARTL